MNTKFEEWRSKTSFSQKNFFDSYVRHIKNLKLASRPNEFYYWFQLKKIRTTSLMSRLNYTCTNQNNYLDSLIINIGGVDIVIIYKMPYKFGSISCEGSSWTMTELKQDGYYFFKDIDENRRCKKIHWNENKWLNIWSVPLHLRAVTNGDKDFRKEYEGGYLVYEGNQYGDTSDFYIIGTLTDKKNKSSKTI